MTYGQVRDRALQLINQYSISGQTVALSYNNQADYVHKVPGLINDCLELLFTHYRHIRAVIDLADLRWTNVGEHKAYVLPKDCWQMCGLSAFDEHGNLMRWGRFRMLGENMFFLIGPEPPSAVLEYYRHPILLDDKTADSAELDGNIEMQMVLPYYVAAHLVLQDDSFAYATLYNEFESRAQKLFELPKAEVSIVEDGYGFGFGGDSVCL